MASLIVSGCVAAPKAKPMVPQNLGAFHKSTGGITVAVSGGREATLAGIYSISDAVFAEAICEAFVGSGLFAAANAAGANRYRLDAFIGQLTLPLFGYSMEVQMDVGYTLTDTQTNQVKFRKNISTKLTATTSDAFLAANRLTFAQEKVAQMNIEQMIREISKLQLE